MRNLFLIFIFAAFLMSCTATSPLRFEETAVLINGNDTTKFVAINSDIITAANALTAVKTGRFAPTTTNGVRVYYSNYTNTHQNMSSKPPVKWIGTIHGYKIYWDGSRFSMDETKTKEKKLHLMFAAHPAINAVSKEDFKKRKKEIVIAPGVGNWVH